MRSCAEVIRSIGTHTGHEAAQVLRSARSGEGQRQKRRQSFPNLDLNHAEHAAQYGAFALALRSRNRPEISTEHTVKPCKQSWSEQHHSRSFSVRRNVKSGAARYGSWRIVLVRSLTTLGPTRRSFRGPRALTRSSFDRPRCPKQRRNA